MKILNKLIFWICLKLLGKRGLMTNMKIRLMPLDGKLKIDGSKSDNILVVHNEFYFGEQDDTPDPDEV